MKRIVAIGGGEIGRPKKEGGYFPVETMSIDKEIIKLTKKKKPKLLFVPTASNDSEGYFKVIKKHFTKLGCNVKPLYLIKENYSKKEIEKEVLKSDIIYVGGGNTLKMMNLWRKIGFDKILKKAYNKGIVLSGLSAGAICWFSYGNSDSRKFTSGSKKLIKVKGLGLVDALLCPHYDFETYRQKDLKRMMKNTSRVIAIALDNSCAIEIIDDKYRIIKSKKAAKAHKIYYKNKKYIKEEIKSLKEFNELKDLLKNKKLKS